MAGERLHHAPLRVFKFCSSSIRVAMPPPFGWPWPLPSSAHGTSSDVSGRWAAPCFLPSWAQNLPVPRLFQRVATAPPSQNFCTGAFALPIPKLFQRGSKPPHVKTFPAGHTTSPCQNSSSGARNVPLSKLFQRGTKPPHFKSLRAQRGDAARSLSDKQDCSGHGGHLT